MENRQYHFADDCPNCGEKDELNKWKGARMGATKWGHDYLCCSDKCGYEFLNSEKRKKLEISRLEQQISCMIDMLKTLKS